MFIARGLTQSCTDRLRTCQHTCVGISPFNGYFNARRISDLVGWALDTYPQSHFFVPDEAPAYTFQALGYSESKARSKARNQGKYVVNKIRTGMAEHGLEDGDDRILTAAKLRDIPRYVELAAEARERFAKDQDFQDAVMTTSGWVLAGYMPPGELPTRDQKLLAVQYFLDELPMFIDTPGIVGVETSTFVYHQEVPFLVRLFDGELDWQAAEGQSFTVLEAIDEDLDAEAEELAQAASTPVG